MTDFQVTELSDVGRARSHNEDYLDYYVPEDPQQLATKGAIYLVADGMGGHQAGEVASRQAVEVAIDQYYSDATHDVGSSLVRAFRAANQLIYNQAQSDPTKAGMGTTLVAAAIVGRNKVYIASVGDSRVYIVGPGKFAQITEDHSWVQEQLRAGLLTPEQARLHPQRNVVTRALGSKPSVEVDLFEGQIDEGDALLLCSDGLTGLVEDREIAAVVREQPPGEAVKWLVGKANERGGTDNVTIMLVSSRKDRPGPAPLVVAPPPAPRPAQRQRAFPVIPVIIAGVVLAAALLAVGLFVVRPLLEGTPTPMPTALTATPLPSVPLPPVGTGGTTATGTAPISTTLPTAAITGLVTVTGLPGDVVTGTATTPLPPTVTLIPSRTPTSTRTPKPPQTPALTKTPGAVPNLIHPKVKLVAPQEAEAGSLRGGVVFRWNYDLALEAGEAFQVLIWKVGTQEHLGAAGYWKQSEQTINLDSILPERGGPGQYWWTVVVVKSSTGQRLSPEAGPWQLTYPGPRAPAEPAAQATASPETQQTSEPPPTVGLPPLPPTWTPLVPLNP